jgi:integrase
MERVRNPQGIHRLSAAAVKNIRAAGWHADGGGLYLEVDASGRKRWAMRITINGRRRDFGLGPLHKVSLFNAREKAADYRAKAYRGIDPAEREKVPPKLEGAMPAGPTFKVAAEAVHAQRRATWKNGKHVDQWINSLRDYAFPFIGDKIIGDIGTPEVLQVLSPIWNEKAETARRVRQRIGTVLEWARAAGHRSGDSPIDLLGEALPRHRKDVSHHAALAYADVPSFVAKLRGSSLAPITKFAFEFLILAAARTVEVRQGLRDEIDECAATWSIPGENEETGRRMKSGRDHVVPLSKRCVQILAEAKKLSGDSPFIFPDHQSGEAMSENRFLNARSALGYDNDEVTPHGFRSSFRDWASEETSFSPEVAEMALAHTIKNKTEAAYRRGKLLAKRAELMEAWARFVTK